MPADIGDPGFPRTSMDIHAAPKPRGVISTRECPKACGNGKMRFLDGLYSCPCGHEEITNTVAEVKNSFA